MAKFVMEITLDNAAFGDDPRSEIQFLMEKVADWVDMGLTRSNILDTNGTTVGSFAIIDEGDDEL